MFSFLKREDPHRRALREEFETITKQLRSAEPAVQMAVGHAINMANSLFRKSYSTTSSFQVLPNNERIAYINKLSVMEVKLREETKDLHSSLGFGLFKMWVGAVSAKDESLMQQFATELSHFSKQGDLSALGNAL